MNEERSLDELIEPLIIETSDYKKIRLDRTIYTQFKLFNDFVEIRNSNRKESKKESKKGCLRQNNNIKMESLCF